MNCLLVFVEIGAVGPLRSSDAQHMKNFHGMLGAFHFDVAVWMMLYAMMDKLIPKHRLKVL